MELLWAALAMALLAALAVSLMSDGKPRFRFASEATPVPSPAAAATPAATPAAQATPVSAFPEGDLPTAGVESSAIRSLFVEAAAEQRGQNQYAPPFVSGTDFSNPPAYRDIREAELGQAYATTPKPDRRALNRVAKLGGFRSPEAMATAFGYQSVDQMVSVWDQIIQNSPQFPIDGVGDSAGPPPGATGGN